MEHRFALRKGTKENGKKESDRRNTRAVIGIAKYYCDGDIKEKEIGAYYFMQFKFQ
jgi:hypothetical protein